jgi:hypothetical protein
MSITALAPTLEEVLDSLDTVGHPSRARILLELLYGGQACPKDLAGDRLTDEDAAALNAGGGQIVKPNPRGVGRDLGSVAYHVRELLADGLIELAGERRVRGAVAHDYIITRAGELAVAALARLDTDQEREQ